MIIHDDSSHAIRAIKKAISPSESFVGGDDVEVRNGGKVILQYSDVDIITGYEAGYMQHRVSIMWEKSGIKNFQSLDLIGSYNTNFNEMNRDSVIHAGNYDVVILIN